jgi:hypothetical protein
MGTPRRVVRIGKTLRESICATLYPENMCVLTALQGKEIRPKDTKAFGLGPSGVP